MTVGTFTLLQSILATSTSTMITKSWNSTVWMKSSPIGVTVWFISYIKF